MLRKTSFTVGVPLAFQVLFVAVPAGLAVSTGETPQWVTHKEGQYSVESPSGWTVSANRPKGWVHMTGTQGEHVVIWPVFLPGERAVPGLQAAQSIHLQLARACPYQANWETPQQAGPNVLRALGKGQNMTAISVFAWIASPRGAAGYFYLVSTRDTDFRQRQGDLAKILASFRLGGRAGGAPGGGQFVSFRDPKEGAFTVEVPAGWKTIGGMIRPGIFETRPVVETESPDGQTRVTLNDPELPAFFKEDVSRVQGSKYLGSTIYPYMTGSTYCRYFIEARIPTFCSDLQISEVKDNPPVQGPPGKFLRETTHSITGSLSFSCREQGQPRVGYCAARTKRTVTPPMYVSPLPQGPDIDWRVEVLTGYVAPPEEAQRARTIMDHMLGSFAINPEWGLRQVQAAGAMSRIIAGTSHEIAGMAERGQRYRDAVDDRIAKLRSNATLGVTDVVDPATGRHTTVDSGSNYYWADNRGTILGTNVDTNPSVDFRRLLELPLR